MPDKPDPLEGISQREQATMLALLKMRPEQHKDIPKPATKRGEAQRRRRERERGASNRPAISGD